MTTFLLIHTFMAFTGILVFKITLNGPGKDHLTKIWQDVTAVLPRFLTFILVLALYAISPIILIVEAAILIHRFFKWL